MGKRGRPRKEPPSPPTTKPTKPAPDPELSAAARKTDTLEWLASQMRDGNVERVKHLFEEMTPLAKPEVYQIGKRKPIMRVDVRQGVDYERFGPDGWEAPYVIIRATVESESEETTESKFHYHLGEELLTPIDSPITYQYYWKDGKDDFAVRPGSLVRMNCQLPHRNWAAQKGTRAWMVIRPETRSTVSFGLDTTGRNIVEKLSQSILEDDLKNPGKFALVALGLQPLIKMARHRVGLGIDKLSVLCDISQSSASRIEDVKTANVNVATLAKIAEKLDLDLSRVFPSFNWNKKLTTLEGLPLPKAPLESTVPPVSHFLHPILWQLQNGQRIEHVVNEKWPNLGTDNVHSFIVLAGRVLFDVGDHESPEPIALNTHGVLHIRDNPDFAVQALTACSVLHIVYSSVCVCHLGMKEGPNGR